MKIYLDANAFKFSATRLFRLSPRRSVIHWGGRRSVHKFYEPVFINPNDAIEDPELKKEADLLPEVAKLIKSGRIIAVTHFETEMETWRLRNMDSEGGRFYGADVKICEAPIKYGRIVIGAGVKMRETQIGFIMGIRSARFLEIQKAVGAYQGPGRINANQLLDAFAIWCAEHNNCDAVLSLDFQLARVIAKDPKKRVRIPIWRPSEVLQEVSRGG